MTLTPFMFWGLVVVLWASMQVPAIGNPIAFLGTWIHEMGHGLAAIATGGKFLKMIVSPDFSGVAHTLISGDFAHVIVIVSGLLAPSIVGGFLLVLARGMGQSRLALALLTAGLIATALFWAGDMFTRLTVLAAGVLIGLIAFRAPVGVRSLISQIVAISICLNAFSQIDYFYMKGGFSGGMAVASDTSTLSRLVGLPHAFWAIGLTVFSIGILYLAVKGSGRLANKRREKSVKADP